MTWPDPLRNGDGSAVASAADWRQRRQQLIGLFESSVYGPWPAPPDILTVATVAAPHATLNDTAMLTELRLDTTGPDTRFHLLVVTPNRVQSPAPLFLAANFFGNHRVLPDPSIAIAPVDVTAGPARTRDAGRGAEAAAWDVAETIAAGYAFATFCMSEVVPDDAELAAAPLLHFAGERGGTGAISAWAWAFSRSVDVLATLPGLDADRVIAVGHSRLGKAALWATAVDERIAGVIPSQSGAGGAAPSRTAPELTVIGADGRPIAETVEQITTRFPHWFAQRYADHANRVEELPVDQHELVALCAPRPVLLSNAVDDLWADPAGQFEMLRRADPVYGLLGVPGLETGVMPLEGEHSWGRLGYSLRSGGHSLATEDWPGWRAFADRWVHSGRFLGHPSPAL